MGRESHLPKLLSQQTLQTRARTRSGYAVCELSIRGVGSWIIIFLLPYCFVSFPLSLSIYSCSVKFLSDEERMHAFCCGMIEVEEQPPESLNCQQEGFQR